MYLYIYVKGLVPALLLTKESTKICIFFIKNEICNSLNYNKYNEKQKLELIFKGSPFMIIFSY
jgi:hypothetical protein